MSTYVNMPVCDLRYITSAEQAKQVESITNVALLVTPIDAGDEVKAAIAAIPSKNIASTLSLDKEAMVHIYNGILEARSIKMTDKDVLVFNGIAVFGPEAREMQGSFVGNGVLIRHESLKDVPFSLLNVNGCMTYLDFDSYKVYPKDIELDAEYFSYLSPKTAVIAGKDLKIGRDVDIALFKEKNVLFAAGKNIVCSKALYSYVAAHGFAGQEIVRE